MMNPRNRRHWLWGACLAILTPWAMAQSDAPLRLLVGFAPGGGVDSVARLMVPKLSALLKQNIIVDNRAGAGGNIATEALYKAAGDDNTFMLGTIGSLAVNQHLITMGFNPSTELEMIGMAVTLFMLYALVWIVQDAGLINLNDPSTVTTVSEGLVSTFLTVGVSLSHLKVRLTGQPEVRDVNLY